MDRRRAWKHREMPRDPDGIRQAPAVQRSPERGHVAELGVGEHGRDLQARRARASDQRQRLTPLLLEGGAGRNVRHRAPIGVAEPRFREIQQRAGHPGPHAGPERGRHGDLAIRDLAQRATVLTRHADRMGALFGKTRAVDDQHTAAFGQHLEQPSPDAVGVPGRVRDEVLKALVGDRVGDAGQHRLHRLPIAVAEERHARTSPARAAARDGRSSVETVRASESGAECAPSPCDRSPRASVPFQPIGTRRSP